MLLGVTAMQDGGYNQTSGKLHGVVDGLRAARYPVLQILVAANNQRGWG